MEIIKDIILGIIVGFLFYLLSFKLIDSIFENEKPADKIQKSVISLYIIAIIGITISNTVFTNNPKLKNDMMKYGIIIGSVGLLYNSLILNWDNLDNNNKLLLLGLNFGIILWYIYSKKKEIKKEVDLDKKKISKLKKKLKKHLKDDKEYSLDDLENTS